MIPYRDDNPTYSTPVVNYVLIALNVLVFMLELLAGFSDDMMRTFGMVPRIFWASPLAQSYRIFTSMFLHGGWMHIVGNMLFLYIFGDNIEDVLGHFRYLVFYLVSGVCGALLESLVSPGSNAPMVGASAAISGVIAGYLVFFPKVRIRGLFLYFISMSLPAWMYIIVWIATQFLSGLQSLVRGGQVGGVAYFAHIGGILFGFAYCKLRGKALYRKWYRNIEDRKKNYDYN